METFCIVTTPPNNLMKTIHNRMPMILDEKTYAAWLDGSMEADTLKSYSAKMAAYDVSTRVNSVRNNDEACIEPA